jgi:hypothetical protein
MRAGGQLKQVDENFSPLDYFNNRAIQYVRPTGRTTCVRNVTPYRGKRSKRRLVSRTKSPSYYYLAKCVLKIYSDATVTVYQCKL